MYRPRLSLLALGLTAALVPLAVSTARPGPATAPLVQAENAGPILALPPTTPDRSADILSAAAVARAAEARMLAAGIERARVERARVERARVERARVERARVERARLEAARFETLRARESARRASRSRALAPAPTGSPRSLARQLLADRGQSDQFGCLDSLWSKESGWSVYAANPSGAYGIPQALPGSKMASAGGDWRTSAATQIRWGLGYIDASYGSPCAAWAHSQSHNWY